MVKDVVISFNEPWSGTYVEGKRSLWFIDEEEFYEWLGSACAVLSTKYDNVDIKEV